MKIHWIWSSQFSNNTPLPVDIGLNFFFLLNMFMIHRTAEKSLLEISELQTQLATNLAVQSAHIDQLFADSVSTSENMEAANKQLKDATKRGSSARWVFRFSLGFCAFLVFMDLIM